MCPVPNFCDTDHVMRGVEWSEDLGSEESSAYLCVGVLTASSQTSPRIVLFSPRYARDHSTGARATRAERRENVGETPKHLIRFSLCRNPARSREKYQDAPHTGTPSLTISPIARLNYVQCSRTTMARLGRANCNGHRRE